jgi:uncharacterized protein
MAMAARYREHSSRCAMLLDPRHEPASVARVHLSLTAELLLLVLGVFAGCLGAIVGIGGGIVIVPILVLGFAIDIRIAVATSLVAVVATSTAAGSAYVGSGLSNMRLGMTLEIATTVGGITGGLIAVLISPSALAAIFAVMMAVTAVFTARRVEEVHPVEQVEKSSESATGWEEPGTLQGAYYDGGSGALVRYRAERLGMGSSVSFLAGTVSGLLGVGGGFLKVPAMTLAMRVPIKVAAATSNFMIGVTAIASLFVYFARGYVHPLTAAPVALGVVGGAFIGTALASRVSPRVLQRVLVVVLFVVAVQMALKAVGVQFGG